MNIDVNLLIAWGAVAKRYTKNDFIFYEGDIPRFYHQVYEGKVKMCWYNDEGRLFTQGIFGQGESFGEPPLFVNLPYPSNAMAENDCVVYKLSQDTLLRLMDEYPEMKMNFIKTFAHRIYHKSVTNKSLVSHNPEEKIITFLNLYKTEKRVEKQKVLIPFTRQQLADFIGLRVETVIRSLIKMNNNNKVEIRKHKLYY